MKLIHYLNEVRNKVGEDIVAIRYYYDGDTDGHESDNFSITDTHLIFEDITFDLNIKGQVVDGVFQFVDGEGITVGIEAWM